MSAIPFGITTVEESEVVTVTHTYFVLGDQRFEYSEIKGLLDELEDADCMFSAVTIFDEDLRKSLEAIKVITTNARGSSCPSDRYEEFVKAIEKAEAAYWDKKEA